MFTSKPDYQMLILEELQKLEGLSKKYESVLKLISKRIRKDLWDCGKNDEMLYTALINCGEQLEIEYQNEGQYSENIIVDYVWNLRPYSVFLGVSLDKFYFDKLASDVKIENARVIIEKQWDDILNISSDSSKAFIDVFDDFFVNCLNKYKGVFFHELSDTDILCRVVLGWGYKSDRFIPWDNKDKINRWNPPGKTYLYLSFEKKEKSYSSELSLNEYICLEEIRAKRGEKYSFCHFKPKNSGNIIDLSYNDVELWKVEKSLDIYEEALRDTFVESVLSNPKEIKKIGTTTRSVERYVKKNVASEIVNKEIIGIALAKQYLKMICNTIYKKVDENDDDGKEKAYKSFHVLANYLESNGIAGIIYPCTRTNKVKGKNLVLFNRYDATPIESSIREIIY